MRGISSSLRLPGSLAGPSRAYQPFRPPRIALARSLTSRPPVAPPSATPSPSTPSSSVSSPSSPQRIPSSAGRYLPSLTALSERTGAPVPSLALSFVVLHELTAIVPLVFLYWIFAALGTGASLVAWVEDLVPPSHGESQDTDPTRNGEAADGAGGWRGVLRGWYDEGEKRISRVGKRYGILGYSKDGQAGETELAIGHPEGLAGGAGEKVANALAAYIVVKALLPLRIGVSLAAAPMFARVFLNPIQRLWRRGR